MLSKRNAAIFIAVITVVLTATGIIYGLNNQFDIESYLNSLGTHNNLIFKHFLLFIIMFFSTISLLGVILIPIYIGFESISIGYIIGNFIYEYKMKGLLYSVSTVLINKGLFMLILIYLFIVGIRYLERYISNVVGTNKDYVMNILIPLTKKYIIILIVMFTYDVILYLFGNNFLNYLSNML